MNPLERAENHSVALRWDNRSQAFLACSFDNLSMAPMDLGILYGAMVVERLRTFGRHLPDWQIHWERFHHGCQALGIRNTCTADSFGNALSQLVDANHHWLQSEPDASLIAVATPGNPDLGLGDCTMYLHVQRIAWTHLRSWYRDGTSLVSSAYASGAGSSWPASIKVRNRLGYYLADRQAKSGVSGLRQNPRALGLLRTERGMVADTSVANLLVVDSLGNWLSPDPDTVMIGTSLRFCESLLTSEAERISYRNISFEELKTASELILVGNTACVWHASDVDGMPIGDGRAGPQCRRLQELWCKRVGFDWLSQGIGTDPRPR